MFDQIARLIPMEVCAPALIAGLAWGGLNYLAIAPEVGRRMGDITYFPRCVASVETQQRRYRAERETEHRKLQAALDRSKALVRQAEAEARRQMDLTRGVATFLGNLVSPHARAEIDRLTGQHGFVDKALTLPNLPDLGNSNGDVAAVPAPLPPPDPATREAYCGCVTGRMLREGRTDLTLYTSTLSLYIPETVRNFEEHMARTADTGACGPAPMN